MLRRLLTGIYCSALLAWAGPATAADVIVNEYNAVDGDLFLGNGNSDPFWGQIQGNGGDWFEVAVITDHLDMRDWEFRVVDRAGDVSNEATFSIKLSSDDAWSDLRSGTIITVSEDLGNNIGDYAPAAGRWWINVRAHPSTSGTFATVACVSMNPACPPPAEVNWKVSNNNSQITILDDVGATVFGPAGEGVNPASGISSTEVFKLEDDPSAAITPGSTYNDGTSSTFGLPNVFSAGSETQDFSILRSVVPFSAMTDVRVNEVLSHSGSGDDWVELHNTTTEPIDVGGWFVSDSFSTLTEYEIPASTIIPAGGYLTIDEVALGFGFSSACGDQAILSEGAGGVPTGPRDFLEFRAIEDGTTYGRWPNGDGVAGRMADDTQAAGNSVPLLGPVVISEIMYHPPDPGLGFTIDPEFVELHNVSGTTVALSTDYGALGVHPWAITGGIDFDFDTAQTIAPDGYLVVVNFDPVAEPAKLTEFQSIYGIGGSVDVVGPYSGALRNFEDTIRLRMPDTPDPDGDLCGGSGNPSPFVPRVVVDEVTYTDRPPWPTVADGGGPSLERRNEQAPAAAASNWVANTSGSATPGSANTTIGAPTSKQQKCVNTLNKDLGRIAKTQGKQSCGCIKDASRDALEGQPMAECIADDPKSRLSKAVAKTVTDFDKSCTGNDKNGIPKRSFIGVTDADAVNSAAVEPERGIVFDLFGYDLDSAILESAIDPDGSRCQTSVAKVVKKCIDEQLKAFATCKKSSLKSGSIATSADLAACIGDDPKQKIAKSCDPTTGKVRAELDKRCGPPVDLLTTFAGCGETTAAGVASCAEQATTCRTCVALDLGDDLYRDCDLADDGADNDSCP